MTKIYIGGPKDNKSDYPKDAYFINTTSKSETLSRHLSPFLLGPVVVPGCPFHNSVTMENAWQYSKVYLEQLEDGGPSDKWWEWAQEGWASERAERYPMGKGRKPVGAWYNGDLLGYYSARKKIYIPAYRDAVTASEYWQKFYDFVHAKEVVVLFDYDSYNTKDKFVDVLENLDRPMGHSFILREMLESKDLDY